jgi:hypothetical protein
MNARTDTRERSSRELIADLSGLAERTLADLGGDGAAADYESVRASVQAVSDELQRVSDHLGFDTTLAWDLLSLREWLDSHLLAASALAGPDIDPLTSIELMRRGLDTVVTGLSASAR